MQAHFKFVKYFQMVDENFGLLLMRANFKFCEILSSPKFKTGPDASPLQIWCSAAK